jgi:hypothetical protein
MREYERIGSIPKGRKMAGICDVVGENIERSDRLAVARGFELTHSNANPSPAKPFHLLGTKYGALVRSICALDHAVDLFFGLHSKTPENGNKLRVAWRI